MANKKPFAVVIDTTLLNYLGGLNLIPFLPLVVARVLVPPEVKKEVRAKGARVWRQINNEFNLMRGFFIDCYECNEETKLILTADLDIGEAAVIAQAEVTNAAVIIDEKAGYEIAVKMSLTVIRTGRLLLMLKEAGAIPTIKPYLDELRKRGFSLSEKTYQELLLEAQEQD